MLQAGRDHLGDWQCAFTHFGLLSQGYSFINLLADDTDTQLKLLITHCSGWTLSLCQHFQTPRVFFCFTCHTGTLKCANLQHSPWMVFSSPQWHHWAHNWTILDWQISAGSQKVQTSSHSWTAQGFSCVHTFERCAKDFIVKSPWHPLHCQAHQLSCVTGGQG